MTPELPKVDEFKLSHEERHCSLWNKLDTLTGDRLASLRRSNDADLTPEQTAKVRGRISELKKLRVTLAMDQNMEVLRPQPQHAWSITE